MGDTVRLVRRVDEAPVFDLAALPDPARFRVAMPFACIAALARRGFSRVCWMLRLVMSPVRRAVRLVDLRDFAEEPPVREEREDREEEDRFDVDAAAIVFPLVFRVKESTNLQ